MSITQGLALIAIGVLLLRAIVLVRDMPGVSKRLNKFLTGQIMALTFTALFGTGLIMTLNAVFTIPLTWVDPASWIGVIGLSVAAWVGLNRTMGRKRVAEADATVLTMPEAAPKPRPVRGRSPRKRAA